MPLLPPMPHGSSIHFAVSFLLVLAAGPLWTALRKKPEVTGALWVSILVPTTLGLLKELSDLARNPWSLGPADLRADCVLDIAWNFAGAISGAFLLACTWAAAAGIAKLKSKHI